MPLTNFNSEGVKLTQLLFGSIFLLGVSGVFAAYLQLKERFFSIAMAPLIYMGSIALGLSFLTNTYGILILGYLALFGAVLHLLLNLGAFLRLKDFSLTRAWSNPVVAWKGFSMDFWRRVLNNSAFQVNQSLDVLIASFLMVGSIAAFSIGTNFGHFLLSIVGMALANAAFPKLSQNKKNRPAQKKILLQNSFWILFFTVPVALLGALFSAELLTLLFSLEGATLQLTETVFFWTIISLPAACLIPLLSRFFLANDDSKTPLWINFFSLTIATSLAAFLSLSFFPPEKAILGLALGNFTANFLSATLFLFFIIKTLKKT